MNKPVINIKNLNVDYITDKTPINAVRDVTFEIFSGAFILTKPIHNSLYFIPVKEYLYIETSKILSHSIQNISFYQLPNSMTNTST